MKILGIHDGHCSSAALVVNGVVVAGVQEERFTRLKNEMGHPTQAISWLLESTGTLPSEIDHVVFATRDIDPIALQTMREAKFKISDYVNEMYTYYKPLFYEGRTTNYWTDLLDNPRFKPNARYNTDFIRETPKGDWAALFREERARLVIEQLGISRERVHFTDHHTGHASYAYYACPREENEKAVVITADSWGDGCNATISVVENGLLREIHRTPMCNLARVYRWITLLLGMKPLEHEYKVMGLAPYAKEHIAEPAYRIFKDTLVVDGIDFKWKHQPADMYFYFKEKFEGLRFDGIASGMQRWLEEVLCEWVSNVMKHTGADTLYYSGGLAMNVKANKVLAELPCIRNLKCPPSGGDESQCIGAAFAFAASKGKTLYPLKNAYLGYEVTRGEGTKAAVSFRTNPDFVVIDNPSDDQIADLLARGRVLARSYGRMEFGQRALGNRSILCDPSRYEQIRIINEKIKDRDFWMPFTPSILFERGQDYLVNRKKLDAYYMTVAFDSTAKAQADLKAAIHPYDFTVRPQLVTKEMNPEYYSLIKAFERKTGIGCLLNTSLNLHGIPIDCTAADAIGTMMESDLDGVILPGVLILKKGQS